MDPSRFLTLNLIGSTLLFGVAAKLYLLPRLNKLDPRDVMTPILLLHAFRHLGMMFLSPGATYPGMPAAFAYPSAIGDLLVAVLAVATIPFVRRGWDAARPLVWTFNVAGTIDLLAAITLATINGASAYMGAAYWIPALWVPALLVTHYVTFVLLTRPQPVAVASRFSS